MITRFATWWLERQGRTVLPLTFIGVVLGHQLAVLSDDGIHIRPNGPRGKIIALNGSQVIEA